MNFTRILLTLAVAVVVPCTLGGCPSGRFPKSFDADKKSGLDGKRSGAQTLPLNRSKTDEVSYTNQDRTDWYVVTLKGQPNILAIELHWDNVKSDLMVDVFDEFGKQLSASPSRAPGATQKTLLTQIDRPNTYYIRVSSPRPEDGTVYTLEAKWDATPEVVPVEPPPVREPREPRPKREPREPREPRETPPPKEKPPEVTIQAHIVSAYRESGQLTLHIDKGSSAGVKVGMSGIVLAGPSGEEALSGGSFKIVQVVSEHNSIAKGSILTLGKNTRVAITVR